MKSGVGLGVIAVFFAALTLASSPRLHERVHPSAQHECAATMIASGKCDHDAPPASAPRCCNRRVVPAQMPHRLAPVYPDIRSSVLEHAPPSAI